LPRWARAFSACWKVCAAKRPRPTCRKKRRKYVAASGAVTQHPHDAAGCANPAGWRVWLRPRYTTTIVVPVSYTTSAAVTVTLGTQTIALTESMSKMFTGVLTPPVVSGPFIITVTADEQTSVVNGPAVIDSDGYGYDKNVWDSPGITQTLAGATVTCDYSDTVANEWKMWPARAYDAQVNPQVTDTDGHYAFLIPPGSVRITASQPDYWPDQSPDLAFAHSNLALLPQWSIAVIVRLIISINT
jgi:hypothetical protein